MKNELDLVMFYCEENKIPYRIFGEDLKPGMELQGTVRNVVDFGAFVDCGVHEDGLVHLSRMSKKFIKHPLDMVSVGDIVKVWVVSVNLLKNRVELTMIPPTEK